MALPWHLALKAIPWATILANAPALAQSARTLLSETRARGGAAEAPASLEALAARVAVLEQRDREAAELAARLAAQNAALMDATKVLEARVRWLLVLAGVAAAVAAVTLGVVLAVG
jgi:hypothetical protein